MKSLDQAGRLALTGRIKVGPDTLLHEEILEPQFNFELQHLLRSYLWIEKVLLLEYERMELLSHKSVIRIAALLDQVTAQTLTADPQANISDIAFAMERFVEPHLEKEEHSWHIDRSRNDLQACAQLMFGREQLLAIGDSLFGLFQVVVDLAEKNREVAMPGYTHYQAAQIISPAFWLTALTEQILETVSRLATIYSSINQCPLGAGAMAGQQLPWDRERMATLLGFRCPRRHALVAVASRAWMLQLAGELSSFSVVLSRFVTDLLIWGSSGYSFIDLPDELAAISSSMPQKKNFPVLERIRGRTAHISGFYVDFLLGQRNTPYTNLVEVSKEAGKYLFSMFTEMQSILRLLAIVVERIQFQTPMMRSASEREYVGGFTLANLLTLHEDIPYRQAQVIAGQYIVAAMKQRLSPTEADATVLQMICRRYGYEVKMSAASLIEALSVDHNLNNKQTPGSTSPEFVRQLVVTQVEEAQTSQTGWHQHEVHLRQAYQHVQALLGVEDEPEERGHD